MYAIYTTHAEKVTSRLTGVVEIFAGGCPVMTLAH